MKSAKSVKVVNIVMVAILVAATAFTAVYLFGGVFDAPEEAEAATAVKQGSTGQIVRNIQTKLKNWGYYKGSVDGVFGAQTKTAVKSFQKKNGLTVDRRRDGYYFVRRFGRRQRNFGRRLSSGKVDLRRSARRAVRGAGCRRRGGA